jgi:hypothetical protein
MGSAIRQSGAGRGEGDGGLGLRIAPLDLVMMEEAAYGSPRGH